MFDRRAIMQAAWARYRSHKARTFNRDWFRADLMWAWKEAKDRAALIAVRQAQKATAERVRAEIAAEEAAGTFRPVSDAEIRKLTISATPFRHSIQRIRAKYATAA
ncbi:hypothetical protein H9Q09_22195 [Aurantimonas sp. DM33-3]|uniref:hypothetical protein n=1 Tax=Aurantimonas sp. DM33-3 TaxID=2766955 RepID=UPI001651FB3F|nr:hypothetical protein [Aurantimonas sp. DM33-3]MBC6718882.1 hypothetical protein [Aurantimonas sp. DM33-3]